MAADAPQLHEAAPGNVCFRWARGDEAAVREAMQKAAHVTRLDLVNNRLIGGAIEPRAVLAVADAASDKLTLYSATQVPHHIRRYVAEQLGMAARQHPPDRARCRRRLRLQGQALSRGDDRRLGGAAFAAAGQMDRDPERKLRLRQSGPRSPDPRRACARRAMGISWRCGSRRSPISAPMSRPSAPPSRARSTARCSPASIGRPRFSCR